MTRPPVAALAALVAILTTTSAPRAERDGTALHVLNRITFGATPEDVARVQDMGVSRFIDEQLHPERLRDAALAARLEGFATLGLSSRQIAMQYEIPAMEARRARQRAAAEVGAASAPAAEAGAAGAAGSGAATPDIAVPARQRGGADQRMAADPAVRNGNLPLMELSEQKIIRAVYSERQLEEVLTDFWFNHFNVDARKGAARFMLTEYERDVIRPRVLGHFRDLLGATAKSPAMLFYLDNWMSADPNGPHFDRPQRPTPMPGRVPGQGRRRAGLPPMPPPGGSTAGDQAGAQAARRPTGLNENYGRELLELHTLGVDGGYTQKDVTEVARAFTGWTIQNPRQGGGFRFAPALHDDGEKVVLGHRLAAGGGEGDGERVLDIVASHPATARFISTKLARRFVSDTPPPALVDRMAATFTKTDGDLRAVMTILLTSPEFLSPSAERAKVKTPFEFVVSALRATGAEIGDARALVRTMQQLGMPLYQCQPPTGYADTADTWVNTGALVNRMNVALSMASGRMPGVRVPDAGDAAAIIGGDVADATRQTIARAQTAPQALALALGSPEFQRR